jgi:hypothetical protein
MTRKLMVIAAAILALAAVSGGIAIAAGGNEEQVTGTSAERAKTAALKAVGGGTVLEVERQDGDGPGVFEVEVRRTDGSQVEVHLDDQYQPVGTAADDDSGADDDADEGADSDD